MDRIGLLDVPAAHSIVLALRVQAPILDNQEGLIQGLRPQMAEREWIGGQISFAQRSEIKSKLIAGIEAYWTKQRGMRPMPRRDEIDPVDLAPFLPYLSIVELHYDPFRVRYRLVGTEVVRIIGEDFSNRWLDETGWGPDSIALNLMLYEKVAAAKAPLYGLSTGDFGEEEKRVFEWVLLPLSPDGTMVSHCLSLDDLTSIAPRSRLLSRGL
jgi:hypothetical protein